MSAPSTATITRSRPPAPTPAPRAAPLKPWQITDPTAAVIAALGAGYDPAKTVSDLIEITRLDRGTVVSTIAGLATEGRVTRHIAALDDRTLTVRWALKR